MGKKKTQCHICNHVIKTEKGEEAPLNCSLCGADLVNPGTETQSKRTVVQNEAGGVKANLVEILLTDKRLIFKEDGMSGAVGGGGGLIGGLIGGAIAGARAKKSDKFNEVMLADIVSIDEEIFGLLKNKIKLTVHTKEGDTCSFVLSKKESEQWSPELRKFIA
jgi:hypothetical protein